MFGGRGWIRTTEAEKQQIYSLSPLATREHAQILFTSVAGRLVYFIRLQAICQLLFSDFCSFSAEAVGRVSFGSDVSGARNPARRHARALAGICQYAENTYFGKPSGQLDQLASAVGGVIFADFADPAAPQVEKIHADGLLPPGMTLCVTDTRGSHSELTGEFAAIRQEMEAVAACLGGKVLGQVPETDFWAALPRLRTACGDRAVLRAIHYYEENARTLAQRRALLEKRFADFAALVLESGRASFALCQNVYCATDVRHQGLSVALALSQSILQGSSGAWRMQGGGFAGTIQAYVPETLLQRYHTAMERVFGPGSCYVLRLREQGARQVL